MTPSKCYAVSVSGGKDSTAALLYMLEHYKDKGEIIPYFCDTGWEHPVTYQYLDYLEDRLNIKIVRLKSHRYKSFEDMVMKRRSFPSRIRRFCTQELKLRPSIIFLESLMLQYSKVINVVGVRKDESYSRSGEGKWKSAYLSYQAKPSKRMYNQKLALVVYQPIVDWAVEDVFAYLDKHDVKRNPLYHCGFGRVGCYPCVMAKKAEIELLDEERIRQIQIMEEKLTQLKGEKQSFFYKGGVTQIGKLTAGKKSFNLDDLSCAQHFGNCE